MNCYLNPVGAVSNIVGHAEAHRWRDPRTRRTLPDNELYNLANVASLGNQDLQWLQRHATHRVSARDR